MKNKEKNKGKLKTVLESAEDIKGYLLRNKGEIRPKYHEDYHVELLIDVMAAGKHLNEFCVQAMITDCIVYEWLKKYPKFKMAHEHGKQLCVSYWMEQLAINPDIDTNKFKMISRYLWGFGNIKMPSAKGKTAIEKIEDIWQVIEGKDALGVGMHPESVSKLATLANVQFNIENNGVIENSKTSNISQNRYDFANKLDEQLANIKEMMQEAKHPTQIKAKLKKSDQPLACEADHYV